MDSHVGQLPGLIEELALHAEVLANLAEQGNQRTRFKLMLPGIEPNQLNCFAAGASLKVLFTLSEPGVSFAGFVETFNLAAVPLNLSPR